MIHVSSLSFRVGISGTTSPASKEYGEGKKPEEFKTPQAEVLTMKLFFIQNVAVEF